MSLNRAMLIGNVGQDPEVRTFQDGGKVCKRCGANFQRKAGLSDGQWERRTFCSKRCAATRSAMSVKEMRRFYQVGRSSAEIAAMAGVTAQAVRRSLKADGVQLRNLSQAMKLSHNRPEIVKKLSESATGRRHSEKTKENMRQVIGANHPLWRAGLTISAGGYLQFTSSPANGDHAGRLLHQVICEWKEGKKLREGFHVHHIDGNKLNNHPDNLISMPASEHARLHKTQKTT